MRIGIIDADLLYRKRHRFPNLACMKLSAYWKEQGFETELLLDYSQAGEYDRLYVSKVFTDTFVPEHILTRETTIYGGTGFTIKHRYFQKRLNTIHRTIICMTRW